MKKIILSVAALALFAGCAQNEAGPVNPSAPDLISFSPNTTRGTINTIGSTGFGVGETGFSVWATAHNVPEWYEDIDNKSHTYDGTTWNFSPDPIAWPAATSGNYPMHFYAVFPNTSVLSSSFVPNADPGTDDAGSPPVGQNDQKLSFTYTVQDDPANQIDLLGAKSVTSRKPVNANLAVTFNHLLSKIDFGVKIETGMELFVQGLTLNYVGNTGTYTFADGTANYTPAWTTKPTTFGSTYTYFGTIFPDDQLNGVNSNPLKMTSITPGDVFNADGLSSNTTQPLSTSNARHLFLMPQQADGNNSTTNRSLTITSGLLDETLPLGATTGKTYVVMIYRLNLDGLRLVGYNNADDHLAYVDEATSQVYLPTSGLFVKAAFPLTLKWDPGKGYLYVIPFNTVNASGGFLIDQNYYDAAGNRTNLVVGDIHGDGTSQGPHLKDPVLKNDGYIHLIPVVGDWDDTTGTGGETPMN